MKCRITIDYNKCNGCGKCVNICENTVIQKVNNKVHVVNEKKCDKEGNCIKICDKNALSFQIKEKEICIGEDCFVNESELYNWPVKLNSISCNNRYLEDSDLLIAADCCAYAYGRFHEDFIKDKVVLITCPKYDSHQQIFDKLKIMFETIHFNSIEVVAMSSSCCHQLFEILSEVNLISGHKYKIIQKIINSDGESFK